MRKHFVTTVVASVGLLGTALMGAPVALADGFQFCGMGNDYTVTVDDKVLQEDVAVFSAGAQLTPGVNGTGGTGRESIRMWSRTPTVYNYYRDYYLANYDFIRIQSVSTARMDFRFLVNDSRASTFTILQDGTYPKAASFAPLNPIVNELIGDLLNFSTWPAGTFYKLVANGISVSTIAHTQAAKGDYTISVREFSTAPNLSSTVAWHEAAESMDGQKSGQEAVFLYTYGTNQGAGYDVQLWPQGRVQYKVNNFEYGFSVDHYYWTNPMGVQHTLNPAGGYSGTCWNPNP